MKKKILALILSGCIIIQNSALPVLASEQSEPINETTVLSEQTEVEGDDAVLSEIPGIEDVVETEQPSKDEETGQEFGEETETTETSGNESVSSPEDDTDFGEEDNNEESDAEAKDEAETKDESGDDEAFENNEVSSDEDESVDNNEVNSDETFANDEAEESDVTDVSENSSDSLDSTPAEGVSDAVSINFASVENDTQNTSNTQNIQYAYVEAQSDMNIKAMDGQTIANSKGYYFGYVEDDVKKHTGSLQQYISTDGTVVLPYKIGRTYMVEIGEGVFAGMDDKDPSARNLLPVESASGKTLLESGENTMLERINKERIKLGRVPLVMDTTLHVTARRKTLDMYNKNYFDHNDPNGASTANWLQVCGYPLQLWGENLAFNYESADRLFNQWWTSAEHYHEMMNENYRSIGIGIYKDTDGKVMGTQIFSSVVFQNITNVTIEFGYEKIGNRAFENCSNLKTVTIPSSVIQIADNAFNGCNNELVIRGKEGSYAETYADKHNITFKAINEKSPINKFGFYEDSFTIEVGDWDFIDFNLSPSEYSYLLKYNKVEGPSNVLDYQDNGTIHALSKGTVTIEASLGDLKDTIEITVTDPPIINIDKISFYENELVLYEGESIRPAYGIEPANTTDSILLASSDNSILQIDDNESVTALKAGNALLTVTGTKEDGTESASASINVRVLSVDDALRIPEGLKAVTNITPTLNNVELPEGFSWKEPGTKLKADNNKPVQYFAAQYKNDNKNILQDCIIPLSVSTISGIVVDMPGKSSSSKQKLSLLETYELIPSVKYVGDKADISFWEADFDIDNAGIISIEQNNKDGIPYFLLTPQNTGKCSVTIEVRLIDGNGSVGPLNNRYGTYKQKYTFEVEDVAHVSDFEVSMVPEIQEGVTCLDDGTIQATENVKKFRIRITNLDVNGETKPTAVRFKADKSGVVKVSPVKEQNAMAEITVKKIGTAHVTVTAQDNGKLTKDIVINVKQISPRLNGKTITLNKLKPAASAALDIQVAEDNPIQEMILYEDKNQNNVAKLFEVQMNTVAASYRIGFKDAKTSNVQKKSYKLFIKAVTEAGEYVYPITVKLKNTQPSPKYEQSSDINLFYKDAQAKLTIDSGAENLTNVYQINKANGGPHFETEFEQAQDGTWSALIYPVGVTKNNYKKVAKSIELRFFYNEYGNDYSIVKKINVKSCYKKPTLTTASTSPVIYSNAETEQSVFRIKDKGNGNILTVGGEDNVDVWIDDSMSDRVQLTTTDGEADVHVTLLDEKKKSLTAKVMVSHSNWWEEVLCPVKLTVNNQLPKLSLDENQIIFNSNSVAVEVWNVKASVSGNEDIEIMRLRQSDIVGTSAAARKLLNEGKIIIYPQKDGLKRNLKISLNYGHIKNGTYKYKVYAWYMHKDDNKIVRMKPVTLSIKVTDKNPSASVKAKGKIDISNPKASGITYTPKLANIMGNISSAALAGEYASQFILTKDEDGTYNIKLREDSILEKGKYKLNFTFVLETGIKVRSKEFTIKL